MTLRLIRSVLARILLFIGYTAAILQWLWTLLILVPPLIQSGAFEVLTVSSETTKVPSATPLETSPIVWAVVGVITLLLLCLTVVVLIRLPRTILQTSERFVHQASEAIVPIVTHHKNVPQKNRRIISRRVYLLLQLVLSLVPLVACILAPESGEITRQIIIIVALWLAVTSLLTFISAWLLAPAESPTSQTRSRASRG